MLTTLRGRRDELRAERDRNLAAMREIIDRGELEGRSNLTPPEASAYSAARTRITEIDRELAGTTDSPGLEGRISDLEGLMADDRRGAAHAAAAMRDASWGSRAARREGSYSDLGTFVRDAYMARFEGDPQAASRIAQHLQAERRDVGTGAFTGLVVPQYLVDLYAPKARAGRPFADAIRRLPIPEQGLTVNISKLTTGTSVAAQATENAAVSETDADDTLLTIDVRTYAGMQDVSRQAIERGQVEDVLVADIVTAYHSSLDAGIISGAGTSGTHKGVLSATGINAVTYTDASPTVAELWPKLADAVQQVNSNLFGPADLIVIHPRRWMWLASAVDTAGRPFVTPFVNGPTNSAGVMTEPGGYGVPVGSLFGLPVLTDANVPTNLGAGTNEDRIIVCNSQQLFLWEQPEVPVYLKFEDVGSGTLTIRLVVYGYSAFTAERLPAATSVIAGTGLVAPTF